MNGTCIRCGAKDILLSDCGKCVGCYHSASIAPNKSQHPEQVLMAGGKVASSAGPPIHLIPTVAIVGLAERFALGKQRKGDKSWHAGSPNQECLKDKAWLIERCSHLIHHAMKMRDILNGEEQEETLYENAGAVAWAGAFFLCAAKALEGKSEPTFGEEIVEGLKEFEEDLKKAYPQASRNVSIIHGNEYTCLNGQDTGPMVYFKQLPDGNHVYYSKNVSCVDWLQDGTARKVNTSMTSTELDGYMIPKAQLTPFEGNIGQ